MGYVTADAPTRVELAACVQCGLCLPHCPTFRLTGLETASPRGRLMAMSAVLTGLSPVDESFDEMMSFCLQCRACEAVCPGLVPFGRVMEGARVELDHQRPNLRRRARRVLLSKALRNRGLIRAATWAAKMGQKLRLSALLPAPLARSLGGLRRLERRQSWLGRQVRGSGTRRGTIGLLNGCVMDAWFGPVHDATVAVLSAAGFDVEVPESQTCCGALAAHDGHAAEARRMAEVNREAFAGLDLIVSDAAGCTAHLKDYGHWTQSGTAERVRDATELVAELIAAGELPTFVGSGERVAVQDPCHLRHAQRITTAPREIIAAAGYEPVETDPDGLCCGAAGVYSILRPETSHELGVRKAAQVTATGAGIVSSANPGCEMQLRSHLEGKALVIHPVELYWRAFNGAS